MLMKRMCRWARWGAVVAAVVAPGLRAAPPLRYEAAPHHYWETPLTDAFTRWWSATGAQLPADPAASTELEAVRRMLAALSIPESSQMLVFSATSLQRTIGPHRPRALYFNDELYLGWVPGGRLEIAADDPVVGPVFYILSLGAGGRPTDPERQTRCLNCHGNADTGNLPALLAASVLPDEAGGSLETFKDPGPGHQVPLAQRFGGWHVTDAQRSVVPLANVIGRSEEGNVSRLPNPAGERFSLDRYPQPTSRLLPQLVHEHQVGGVNAMTAALYLARESETPGAPPSPAPDASKAGADLDEAARRIVRYFLFADEAALPPGAVPKDEAFIRDFTRNRRADSQGRSLKDLDLGTRLFRYRCSYLIYTPLWRGLPAAVKDRAWKRLAEALAETNPSHDGAHLPAAERAALREIIADTCDDRPSGWTR